MCENWGFNQIFASANTQALSTSSGLGSPFSAGVSSFAAAGSASFFSVAFGFGSLAFFTFAGGFKQAEWNDTSESLDI